MHVLRRQGDLSSANVPAAHVWPLSCSCYILLSRALCFPLGHWALLFLLPSSESHPGRRPEVLDLKTKLALPGPQITSVCPV